MPFFLSQNVILLLFPLFFLVIFLLSMGVVLVLRQRQKTRALVRKIQHGGLASDETSDGSLPEKRALLLGETESKSSLISFFSFFSGKKHRQVLDIEQLGAMKIKFLQAGIKSRNIDAAFYGAKLFFPVLLVVAFLFVKLFLYPTLSNTYAILILVLLGLFGFYLPDIWLKQKTDKRKVALFKALPDALDLLVVCVEAGMGLDAALLKVGQEIKDTYPDLSREFAYLNLEIRAGKHRSEALKNLYLRTGIDEMNSLVTLLIQTDKFGTSISKALQVFSESFRTKRYQMAEEIAAKLPVKIVLPLILFIFPALFVFIIGPAAITIYQTLIKGL